MTGRLCICLLVAGAHSAAIRVGLRARSRRRAPIPAASDSGGVAARLEQTYRTSGVQRQADAAGEPGSLLDVPLICHRWAGVLPGVLQSLHVSDPSLVHVFQSLATEEHGKFGYFEGADRNHSPYLALSGPGVLMELREVRSLDDGRLIVVALAVARVRAQRLTTSGPFPRGDLLLLPDDEEQAAARLSLRQGGLDGAELNEVARAASAAAALTWASAETGRRRAPDWSSNQAGEGQTGRAVPESLEGGEGYRYLSECAPLNLSLSIWETARAARRAAVRAAEEARSVARDAAPLRLDDPLSRALEAHFGAAARNGLAEPGQARDEAVGSGTAVVPEASPVTLSSNFDSYSQPFLLALEQALWREMVLCIHLSGRLKRLDAGPADEASTAYQALWMAAPQLDEMLPLVPPPPAHGWPQGMPPVPASAEWLSRFGYPPLRRAQRLSYLMAALLPELATVSMLPSKLDRRSLLRMASVRERLQAGVVFLNHQRLKLAALVAIHDC